MFGVFPEATQLASTIETLLLTLQHSFLLNNVCNIGWGWGQTAGWDAAVPGGSCKDLWSALPLSAAHLEEAGCSRQS